MFAFFIMNHPKPANSSASLPDARPVDGARVLVVDDKEIVRDFLRSVLEMAGYAVTTVSNGVAALDAAREEPPEVVLTDLQMSPMGGSELVTQIAEISPASVCIVLTGYGTVERAVELMRAGAFDVLTKPCRATEILATVEKAREHHMALRSNLDLRQQLRVKDKLAMIGKLAAGVAHELNNPLDATLRCVRLTKSHVADDPEATEYLDLAHAGLQRMANIVQSLLKFSRNAAIEQTPEPLNTVIQGAVAAVNMALGTNASPIEVSIDPGVSELTLPRGIHQVLINLMRNANDANLNGHAILVRAFKKAAAVHIEVVDHGTGISEDVLARIFEPFYTTKEPGKGTGLGLPISARLVEKFGGSLSVESPRDGGTVARIVLPRDRADPSSPPPPSERLTTNAEPANSKEREQ